MEKNLLDNRIFLKSDSVAAEGMRILGHPLGADKRIISGESRAVTTGAVAEILRNPALAQLQKELGLGRDSRILCISTEGATNQKQYREIVWDGSYAVTDR